MLVRRILTILTFITLQSIIKIIVPLLTFAQKALILIFDTQINPDRLIQVFFVRLLYNNLIGQTISRNVI